MDNRVKITHVAKFAKPHNGGIESFIEMFNTCVKDNNVDLNVLCCSNEYKSSKDENGVFYNRARYFFEFAANTFSLDFLWKLFRLKTDILIYHMPFIFAVVAHFICRPKYKKMVVCYHSDIIGYDKVMKPFEKIYKKFLQVADVIHVQSPQMVENSLVRDYKDKTVMIPYLIDSTSKHNPENVKKIREKYPNEKIIFALGRHVKYKGFEYLIKAMEKVEDAVLLIGGKGPLTENYLSIINEKKLEAKVFLLGRVSDEEIEDYYEACDIFALPSILMSETFAVVQLEAMKHSKPVINTLLNTGVNYVSIDNETGLTVEAENVEQLSNAINKLVNDDELRIQLGKNARKRVQEVFDIEKNKHYYRELFKIE